MTTMINHSAIPEALSDHLEPWPNSGRPRIGGDLATDVYVHEGKIVVMICAPGVRANQFEISVEQDALTVAGRRDEEALARSREYRQKEIRRGSFMRTILLPSRVDPERAKARYEEGMLVITIPCIDASLIRPTNVLVSKARRTSLLE